MRLKKKVKRFLYITVPIITLGALYGVVRATTSVKPKESDVLLVYGERSVVYPDYEAKGIIKPSVTITDNINYDKTGTYEISYKAKILGLPIKTVNIPAELLDMEAPVIELEEGTVVFTKVNEPLSYPSYSIKDNYNTPEELDVSITGDLDTSAQGTYEGRLTACDVSKNCTARKIKVVVGDISDEEFKPGNFNLFAYDYEKACLRQEGEPLSQADFDDIYFIGDSNTINFGMYEGLNPQRVIGRYALSPASFDLPAMYNNVQTQRTITDLVGELRPRFISICMGEAEAASGDPLRLAESYKTCLDQLHAASPDTKIYVSAIFPIVEGSSEAAASQEEINRANYCIRKMCAENGYRFIYGPEVLMSETGYGYTEYYVADGYHLSGAFYNIYFDYIKNTLKY